MGEYYERNHLRANPNKTPTSAFHLKNREAIRTLNITWYNKHAGHIPNPVYLGVTFDRTLNYKEHIHKLKCKTSVLNNILRMLSNIKWGANPATIKTTALALCYSTAKYVCHVWERSTHVSKLDSSLRQTSVDNVYFLAGITPTTWCQKGYHISIRKKYANSKSQEFPIQSGACKQTPEVKK